MRQNVTIPGPETELYGVEWHSGSVGCRRPAPGCPDLALGAFSSPPWARSRMLHLTRLNAPPPPPPGHCGWTGAGPGRGVPGGVPGMLPQGSPRALRHFPCIHVFPTFVAFTHYQNCATALDLVRRTTMPCPQTELYGVKWHTGVVGWRRPAPGCPDLALGAFSSPPWARSRMLHLTRLNGPPGHCGWTGAGPSRGVPGGVPGMLPQGSPRGLRHFPCIHAFQMFVAFTLCQI